MKVTIKKKTKQATLNKAFHKSKKNPSKNNKTLTDFFGKFITNEDGLKVQKKLRNEWN